MDSSLIFIGPVRECSRPTRIGASRPASRGAAQAATAPTIASPISPTTHRLIPGPRRRSWPQDPRPMRRSGDAIRKRRASRPTARVNTDEWCGYNGSPEIGRSRDGRS